MPKTENAAQLPPKVFVSYSWTGQAHVERILAWCERLVADGVDVEIDRWSLSEGHDKFAFMEKMVTDPSITHVLIFTDARYAEKANDRAKGVGTESQIISAEIYGRTTQEKFIPILCEFDANGEPCLPVFLKTRIYIDFSTPEHANDNWETLIRRLYKKPLLTKPRLGKAPAYLEAGSAPASITASKFIALKKAVHDGRPNLRVWIADYVDAVVLQLEEFRLSTEPAEPEILAERLHASLDAMLPLRNEVVDFFSLLLNALPAAEGSEAIGEFLERLLPFKYRSPSAQSYSEWWFDNFGFLLYELFLYAVAAHLRQKQFDGLALLLGRRYVLPDGASGNSRVLSFDVFRHFSRLLSHLNEKSQSRRLSIEADLVHKRATLATFPMMMLMQADLLCCLRSILRRSEMALWPPLTAVYAEYLGTLELFLRAQEKRFFLKIALVLGVTGKAELDEKLTAWSEKQPGQLSWLFRHGDISLETLAGLEKLDTIG